ncbi:BEL1-like homeodomain protein 11 [Andrographis paniculata]|uniref:BEL1-like homeodomain protein 11 n=1 Tax=Andrographis paniculata TaxID=175694 RepID=UPI0021E737FE|nr:BEL1-like homeodomain protein 11 [Andrographis paniculata]XP_051124469.1 BEL1-like homeodomain protein 11 [Andrographis paniculata]XP_051124470.1 BEL1-like homeodomain protein 11 [Andrographis paniculata]XP_051124472.1 BEL1-like homeodomain protein 11 [Andrographis paniculata]
MAEYYPSEGDMLPTPPYLLNHKPPSSYPSSDLQDNNSSNKSLLLSYSNLLSGHDLVVTDQSPAVTRDEMLFMPPPGVGMLPDKIDNPITFDNTLVPDNTLLQHSNHGLSLTLGSQDSSLLHLNSDSEQFAASAFHQLLHPNVPSELHLSPNNGFKNTQYLSFDFSAPTQDAGSLCSSRYLKAAQDLLDEIVTVHRAPKMSEKVRNQSNDANSKRDSLNVDANDPSTDRIPRNLSPADRHDLQNKITKLLGMLDEVDRRYKQYCHQMQVVSSSFEMAAGRGAAHPYTSLAQRTISRQFRCLCDAIKKQIQSAQRSLGEEDSSPNGVGVLSRLRYVDQQLRQQKAIQQFGVMRQPWRPQRGLPETAVSILRAWLFEHFLHPYPKDSEKIVLGRQTGLTRNQVANWFINARVRLWKPMIEEMYKEEFGGSEVEPKSSEENAGSSQEMSALDNQSPMQSSNIDVIISNTETNGNRAGLVCDDGTFRGDQVSFGLMQTQVSGEQTANNSGRFANAHLLSDFVA